MDHSISLLVQNFHYTNRISWMGGRARSRDRLHTVQDDTDLFPLSNLIPGRHTETAGFLDIQKENNSKALYTHFFSSSSKNQSNFIISILRSGHTLKMFCQ